MTKEQKKAYNQAYYVEKRKEVLARKKEYYEKNRESILLRVKESYDPQGKKKYNDSYREKNAEKLREYDRTRVRSESQRDSQKASRRRWSRQNAEHVAEVNKDWYARMKSDPERYAKWLEASRTRVQNQRKINPHRLRHYGRERKARCKGAPGRHSFESWVARCQYYGWCCAYCHKKLTISTAQKEHVKAIRNGGSNWASNLVPACASCNSSKGIKNWKPLLP